MACFLPSPNILSPYAVWVSFLPTMEPRKTIFGQSQLKPCYQSESHGQVIQPWKWQEPETPSSQQDLLPIF